MYHWLESALVVWVHLAPVCGTCSRARQIGNGGPRPPPTDSHPMGIPDLTSVEGHPVDLANNMYAESCNLLSHCPSREILATVEHPSSSLFWLTDPFLQLGQDVQLFQYDGWNQTEVDWNCRHFSAVSKLNVACDGQHTHTPALGKNKGCCRQ